MRFDLTDLRVFLHTCEAGSMTEAAERSHLTLAAVSARLRALEDTLGIALLERHRRGVTPTSAGTLLARHASLVFHQLGALRKDLARSDTPTADRPTLLLGNSSALGRPLASILAEVLGRHPGARLTVRESGSEVTVHAVRTGLADLGLIRDAIDTTGLATTDLGPDPLLMAAAPGHPLAAASSVSLPQLLSQDWVAWSEAARCTRTWPCGPFRRVSPSAPR